MTEIVIDRKKYVLIPEKNYQVLQRRAALKTKPEKIFTVEQARAHSKSVIRKAAGTGVRIVYKTTTSNSSFLPKVAKLNKLLSKAKLIK